MVNVIWGFLSFFAVFGENVNVFCLRGSQQLPTRRVNVKSQHTLERPCAKHRRRSSTSVLGNNLMNGH